MLIADEKETVNSATVSKTRMQAFGLRFDDKDIVELMDDEVSGERDDLISSHLRMILGQME